MNCAVCGKDNQPGTRFCVHCGASLAAPAAAAARPAPAAAPARPAPAPSPSPTATGATVARPAAPAGTLDTGTRTAANPVPPESGAGVPAYEAEPRGGGAKILLGIGLAALVIAGGFVGYKIFGGSADVKDSFARFDTTSPSRVEPPASPPAAAPPSVAKEPAPETTPTPTPPAPEPAKAEEKAPPKTDASKAPATEADKAKAALPGAKGEGKATGKGAAGAPAPGSVTPAAPAPAPVVRPAPPVIAPPPAEAPVQDRWAQMSDELQRCQKESLFSRIVCDQRVRLRFCDGYWGKVSQCPGNVVNPDRGQ